MNEKHVNNNKINQNAFLTKESILFYVYIAVF